MPGQPVRRHRSDATVLVHFMFVNWFRKEEWKGLEWHLLTLYHLSTAVNAIPEALARAHREYGVTEAVRFVCVCVCVCISYHTTHTTTAERRVEKQCRRRGASSGQKTKRGIEEEDPSFLFVNWFVKEDWKGV